MKTKRTLFQWAGHVIGALFFCIAAFVPTGIYAVIWWFVQKTFWPILWTALGGSIWLVAQVIWALKVGLWWDNWKKDPLPTTFTKTGDGDLDISY